MGQIDNGRRQLLLFAEPEVPTKIVSPQSHVLGEETSLEGRVEAINPPQIPKNWGITKALLNRLQYPALEAIFYGIHNVSVSVEMLNVLNPDETLAVYSGAGHYKRGNQHFKLPRNFPELIKALNSYAYARDGGQIGRTKKSAAKRFDNAPNQEQARLQQLPEGVKAQFVYSFFSEYIPSDRDNSWKGQFRDPNTDGQAKQPYIIQIMSYFQKRFERETPQRRRAG